MSKRQSPGASCTPCSLIAKLWPLRTTSRVVSVLLSIALPIFTHPTAAQSVQPHPQSSSIRYDGAGRVVGKIAPDPDGAGPLGFPAVRTRYDALGLPVSVETGELANWQPSNVTPDTWSGLTIAKTEYLRYDSLNKLIMQRVVASDGQTKSVVQKNYDYLGREACVATRMNDAAFAQLPANPCQQGSAPSASGSSQVADRISKSMYDAAGQLVQVRRGVGTPLEQAYATYAYSPNGKQTDVIDANGNHAQMVYDGFDRLGRWSFPARSAPTGYNPATVADAFATAGAVSTDD